MVIIASRSPGAAALASGSRDRARGNVPRHRTSPAAPRPALHSCPPRVYPSDNTFSVTADDVVDSTNGTGAADALRQVTNSATPSGRATRNAPHHNGPTPTRQGTASAAAAVSRTIRLPAQVRPAQVTPPATSDVLTQSRSPTPRGAGNTPGRCRQPAAGSGGGGAPQQQPRPVGRRAPAAASAGVLLSPAVADHTVSVGTPARSRAAWRDAHHPGCPHKPAQQRSCRRAAQGVFFAAQGATPG